MLIIFIKGYWSIFQFLYIHFFYFWYTTYYLLLFLYLAHWDLVYDMKIWIIFVIFLWWLCCSSIWCLIYYFIIILILYNCIYVIKFQFFHNFINLLINNTLHLIFSTFTLFSLNNIPIFLYFMKLLWVKQKFISIPI